MKEELEENIEEEKASLKKDIKKTFRFSSSEYLSLVEKSAKANMNISEYIRSAAKKSEVQESTKKEIINLTLQIAKIGNNLNQIARKVNTKKIIDVEVLKQLKKIEDELRKCL